MLELDRLQPVELRDIWPNEAADFTPWLAKEENLAFLGETLGMELELEGQEIAVGDFQADILCRDTMDDSQVLIENQLERTDHSHLGQILTYSAGLDIHTVIWIAKEFREEHRAALDRLNEITDEHYQYFGIEVKVWQIGDSARAPQFEIVSKPNGWNRTVSRDTEYAVSEDSSERQQLGIKYWTEFLAYMQKRGSQLRFSSIRPQNFLRVGMGASITMSSFFRTKGMCIGITLYTTGRNATAHFHLLKDQQAEIEEEFGESLEWEELPGNKSSRISLRKEGTDPGDEVDWPNQHEWLASKLEMFDKVFRQRIRELNADDWEPPIDEDEV